MFLWENSDIKFMTYWGRVFAAVIKEGPAFFIIFTAPRACSLKWRVGAKSNPEIRVWEEGRTEVCRDRYMRLWRRGQNMVGKSEGNRSGTLWIAVETWRNKDQEVWKERQRLRGNRVILILFPILAVLNLCPVTESHLETVAVALIGA